MIDYAEWDFWLSVAIVLWIVYYSLTLLKRTKPLDRIFGPVPDDLWEDMQVEGQAWIQSWVEGKKRERLTAKYQEEQYGRLRTR